MIRMESVAKRYRTAAHGEVALHGIDLSIEAGELCAIVGTSGSGKTTLLNLMGGLDRGYTGSVTVDGQDLRSLTDTQLSDFRNRRIGFVFQHFSLLDHLTALQNVLLPYHFLRGQSPFGDHGDQGASARARQALDQVGLSHKYDERPATLSGGQKQRIAIARALFFSPRILLCDEPTGSLDTKTGQQIIDLFRELNTQGYTVVIITHESRVSTAARRVIRIEDGRITADAASEAA